MGNVHPIDVPELAIEAITMINALLHGEQIVQMVVPLQNMSRRLMLN